jgi:hypothetical protein
MTSTASPPTTDEPLAADARDTWPDWQWQAWHRYRRHTGPDPITPEQLLKATGPRRYGIKLADVVAVLPELEAEATNVHRRRAEQDAALAAASPCGEPHQHAWRLIHPRPFPAAAAMATALLGRKPRRRPVPMGRDYCAATWWDVPGSRASGIAYQHVEEPEAGPGGTFIASMGARFKVLATGSGLYVRRLDADLSAEDLAIACAAIEKISRPESLAAYGAAAVAGCRRPQCIACGRSLADPEAMARGFGPECWGRLCDAIRGAAAVNAAS